MAQNKNRPDFECAAYARMKAALKIINDACESTLRIRECRTEYLPKNPAEDDGEYNTRLNRSVFMPATKRALGMLVGLVFRKDPNLKDVDSNVEQWWKNIDLAGTKGEVFLRNALYAAAKDGHSFIYVEMPPKVEQSTTLAPEPTALDEHLAGLRPYLVMYRKGQAINWRVETINERPMLTQITFRESTMEGDGAFGEAEVVRYRVLRPGSWQVYKQVRKQIVLESEGETSLDYIPLFPVYGEEIEPYCSMPPLLELALLNIQHYQKQSDLDNILHIANVPVMWARDRNLSVPFQAVGPTILMDLKGEHSAVGFAEHEGKAIAAAQKDIEAVESRMAMASLQMLAEKTAGPKTATGEIIDTAESNSELSLMVKSLHSAAQNALDTMCRYMGSEPKGTIEFNVEYDRLVLSVEEMRVLREYAADHLLSVETVLELLKRAGKLGVDFDIQKELVKLFGADGEPTADERAVQEDTTRKDGTTGGTNGEDEDLADEQDKAA